MRVLRVMLVAVIASNAGAQSSIAGFWVLTTQNCAPPSVRCRSPFAGSWSPDIAIDVQRNTVMISGQRAFASVHIDTLTIDGRGMGWLPGRRGITHRSSAGATSNALGEAGTRTLWPGESWRLTADGSNLVHEYQWILRDTTFRMIWTYKRTAG